jgi:hypothetical protein
MLYPYLTRLATIIVVGLLGKQIRVSYETGPDETERRRSKVYHFRPNTRSNSTQKNEPREYIKGNHWRPYVRTDAASHDCKSFPAPFRVPTRGPRRSERHQHREKREMRRRMPSRRQRGKRHRCETTEKQGGRCNIRSTFETS